MPLLSSESFSTPLASWVTCVSGTSSLRNPRRPLVFAQGTCKELPITLRIALHNSCGATYVSFVPRSTTCTTSLGTLVGSSYKRKNDPHISRETPGCTTLPHHQRKYSPDHVDGVP